MKEYNFNKYQTPLTEGFLKDLDGVSQGELYECLDKIHLLSKLVATDRKYAKDLQRWDDPRLPDEKDASSGQQFRKLDPKGRIVINFTNPHILTDMDYFRPAAIHFEKYGVYTKFFKNPDPNSDYMRFWKEERRRCLEGYTRESDGEWIPGYFYHYLNYGRVKVKVKVSNKRAYEKEAFPNIYDSDYWFFHYVEQGEFDGEFGSVLKKRRWGYSYKLSNMCDRNYVHIRKSKSYILASQKEYIYRDGPMPKFKENLAFIETHTPFWSPRSTDTIEQTRAGYKDPKLGVEKGRLSEVMGVTCKDDPDKGRGKAGKLVAFEEFGVFPQIEKTWTVTEESVKQGDLVYGYLLCGGTGGSEGADFAGAEKMHYNPRAYNIKALKNIYSKTNGNGICGMFVPAYLSFEECYNKDGNSDAIGALVRVLKERQKIRIASRDSNRLIQKKAEMPITPEEAVLRVEGSIFPVLDIKDYLSTIRPMEEHFTAPHYIGEFTIDLQGEVKFKSNGNLVPIRHYPTKPDVDKRGAVEIFEMPKKVSDNERYIIGIDTFDDDVVEYSTSLGSMLVFDRWTRRIVGEYTGRPDSANAFYEIAYRMSRFYNAKIMYENNKKGLFAYFSNVRKALHMLADSPEFLADKQIIKATNLNNTTKGVNATQAVNVLGRRLQADWMISDAFVEEEIEVKEGEIAPKLMNLQKIRSIGYLQETEMWTPDGNFDRISAMNMVMIYDAELQKYETGVRKEKIKTLADDPFFNKHYRGKRVMGSYPIN